MPDPREILSLPEYYAPKQPEKGDNTSVEATSSIVQGLLSMQDDDLQTFSEQYRVRLDKSLGFYRVYPYFFLQAGMEPEQVNRRLFAIDYAQLAWLNDPQFVARYMNNLTRKLERPRFMTTNEIKDVEYEEYFGADNYQLYAYTFHPAVHPEDMDTVFDGVLARANGVLQVTDTIFAYARQAIPEKKNDEGGGDIGVIANT